MSSILGKWNVLTKSPLGDIKAIWEFYEKDGIITGTVTAEGDVREWESVKVVGDEFELITKLKLPFGVMDFSMKGTLTENEMSGISKMKMGKSEFIGTRE